ncbi:MAG: hypothetical protein JAY90_04240 [Candidatus Thiodiazotropha lotti]|nr:hypothetical protein [Candidatus Thiodiazotropha lotti]
MGMLPPLQVTVDARNWSVILDVRLALHRLGLLMATRLAEELRVFLVPTLWEILDDTAYLNQHPEQLAQAGRADSENSSVQVLGQWERARVEFGLTALHIFWAGDALHESSLPKDMDPGLNERFSTLVERLSKKLGEPWQEQEMGWRLQEGSRDAVALAAAMSRYRPVILTLCESADDAPSLCNLLSEAGLHCRQLKDDESEPMRNYFKPLLARSGVVELLWEGLQLVMVHTVAPQALFVGNEEALDHDPFTRVTVEPDLWSTAGVYWYRL